MSNLKEQILDALNRPKDQFDEQKIFDGVEIEGCSKYTPDHAFIKVDPKAQSLQLSLDIEEVSDGSISFFTEFWKSDGSFLRAVYLATCFSDCCPDERKIEFPIPNNAAYGALNFRWVLNNGSTSGVGLMKTKENDFPVLVLKDIKIR